MIIYLGADHRGYHLKGKIKLRLKEWGYDYEDLGNMALDPDDDYPESARVVGERVMREMGEEKENKGILVCGSGVGMCVTANKIPGIRCGLGFDPEQIRAARKEDNINCLALPADFVGEEEALDIVDVFLKTPFDNEEKHKRRIKKIEMKGGE